MMRNTVTLALICTLILCASCFAGAQGISVTGRDALMLAKAIIKQAETSYRLPSAYIMRIGDRPGVVITAPCAFEILARTLLVRQTTNVYPQTVSGLTLLYNAKYDPKVEPAPDQQRKIAIWTPEIVNEKVPMILEFISKMQNTIPRLITLADGNKLTPAQFTVAMAKAVASWGEVGKIPELTAVPAVYSPPNWDDQRNPVPIMEPVSLRIAVNGVYVQRKDENAGIPDALSLPFCGNIQINLMAEGPVKALTLDLDSHTLCAYDKRGSYGYSIDSLHISDGNHRLTLTLTDEDNKSFLSILPLQIQNGRVSAFTPAEIDPATTIMPNT